jgi:hypothetical protein
VAAAEIHGAIRDEYVGGEKNFDEKAGERTKYAKLIFV